MLRAGYGLVWEEWRRTRKLFLLVLSVLTGIAFIAYYGERFIGWTAEVAYGFLSGPTVVAFMVYLPLSRSTKANIQAGIPTRRYLLPVGTLSLVLWPLLFRLMLVATLASTAWLFGLFFYEKQPPYLVSTGLPLALAATVHMLAWSARFTGKWITTAGFLLLVFPGSMLTFQYYRSSVIPSPARELLFPAIAIVVALAVSTLSLKVMRSGGWGSLWRGKARTSVSSTIQTSSGLERRPFQSVFLAQIWYEWRSMGRKMTIILCCPSIAFSALLASIPGGLSITNLLEFGPILFMVLSIPVGLLFFGKRETSARQGSDFFARTRPVDDALLGWARIGNSAVTILASFVIVVAALSMCQVVLGTLGIGLSMAGEKTTPFTYVPIPYPMVLAYLAGAWIAHTRGAFVVTAYIILAVVVVTMHELAPHTWGDIWERIDPVLLAPIVCSLPLCLTFVRGLRRGVVSKRAVLALSGVWVLGIVTVSCIVLPAIHDLAFYYRGDDATLTRWVWGAALMLLALSPFATSALSVHRQRHR